MYRRHDGVFAGGALHWVSPNPIHFDLPNSIVAFNLTAEEFREVPLPYGVDWNEIGDKKTTLDVGLWRGAYVLFVTTIQLILMCG